MERIKTIATRDLTKSVKTGGCGECQTSCQYLKLINTTGISRRNWVNAKLIAFSMPSRKPGKGQPIM